MCSKHAVFSQIESEFKILIIYLVRQTKLFSLSHRLIALSATLSRKKVQAKDQGDLSDLHKENGGSLLFLSSSSGPISMIKFVRILQIISLLSKVSFLFVSGMIVLKSDLSIWCLQQN